MSDDAVDLAFVAEAVGLHGREPGAVIPILQALQAHYRYLPEAALSRVCELTAITPVAIAGVATFYDQFRHLPAGRHLISMCHGTACHVKGSEQVDAALRRCLKLAAGEDTDAERRFTLQRVACLGCCTLAPVAQIDGVTYGHLAPDRVAVMLDDVLVRAKASNQPTPAVVSVAGAAGEIRIGVGSCCVANGSQRLREALERELCRNGCSVAVKPVGCVGMCHQTPLVEVVLPSGSQLYAKVQAGSAAALVDRHFPPRSLLSRAGRAAGAALDRLLTGEASNGLERQTIDRTDAPVCAFLGRQVRIATEHSGLLTPLDLDEYLAHDGFSSLRRVLADNDPAALIEKVSRSKLRGRGGAGFPTGRKWAAVRQHALQTGTKPYLIANGDEGDPGAFMDRMILESFPFRVIEGLAIAAQAVGAEEGVFYIRAEYPLAVSRIRAAIAACTQRGFLGANVMDSGRRLELRVMEGAGAFVCGEETALIASLEGRRGMPRLRPPFPAESGLWGRPTCVNNVETLAVLPWIVRQGPETFAALGHGESRGTKVFALAGKVLRGGLIEVPMGITLRQIVEDIGGGVAGGRTFKAVQIGGPSGGCLPASRCDIPVDYEALAAEGAIMGSGGLVVLDDRDCMVDMARYFLRFTQDQSCGKCTFCRLGTKRMLDILDRLCTGLGRAGDLEELAELAATVKAGSLCGLGQTAPNPVLTTLRHFRDEYEAHLAKHCPAGRCTALIRYQVNDKCTGCTACAQRCPVEAIPFTPYRRHAIDTTLCTRCDLCRTACPVQAIEVVS
jgi:NADH-quinone oxidoreductase subunit F